MRGQVGWKSAHELIAMMAILHHVDQLAGHPLPGKHAAQLQKAVGVGLGILNQLPDAGHQGWRVDHQDAPHLGVRLARSSNRSEINWGQKLEKFSILTYV